MTDPKLVSRRRFIPRNAVHGIHMSVQLAMPDLCNSREFCFINPIQLAVVAIRIMREFLDQGNQSPSVLRVFLSVAAPLRS